MGITQVKLSTVFSTQQDPKKYEICNVHIMNAIVINESTPLGKDLIH